MPRKRLSEYRAKVMLHTVLQQPYAGWSVDATLSLPKQLRPIQKTKRYVMKVDRAIKGRYCKGLVRLDIPGEKGDSLLLNP